MSVTRQSSAFVLFLFLGGCAGKDSTEGTPTPSAKGNVIDASEAAAEGERIYVPSDPAAEFYILERRGSIARPIIATKRVGKSGSSFATREYDCAKRMARYLSDGDDRASLAKIDTTGRWGPLLEGSIADVIGSAACRK
jgi:hypothetical protein